MIMFARFTKIFNWIRSHKYLFVTIIFLVIVVLIDDKSMIKHFENRHKIAALEKEIAQMKRDSLEIERKNDRMVKIDIPKDGDYFIFRARTVTNELGQVTHANYGRIGEKLNLAIGLSIKTWFNAKDSDTNLEDARAW